MDRASLLFRLVDAERAEIERVIRRYASLFDFTGRFEAEEASEFAERTERHVRLGQFTRQLETEHSEREARAFEARVALFLREAQFMRRLMQRREVTCIDSSRTDHWHLYGRD